MSEVTTIAAPEWLTRRERERWQALHRRLHRLERRMDDPRYVGDKGRQLAEAGAIRWALRVIADVRR